jgi:glycosyl transferase family 25
MKAYLLNLDRSPDRLVMMRKEFDRVGVPFTRLSGVDTRGWSSEDMEAFFRERSFSPEERLPGDAGAFLSHLAAWQEIAAGEDRAAAIFEDDVHLASDLKQVLSTTDWMPADADIVRLESNSKMILRDGRKIGTAPRRKLYRAHSGTWGAAGYILTKEAAVRLAQVPTIEHTHIDWLLFKPTRSKVAASLVCYQFLPALCIQDDYLHGDKGQMQSIVSTGIRVVPKPPKPRPWAWLLPHRKRPVPFRP